MEGWLHGDDEPGPDNHYAGWIRSVRGTIELKLFLESDSIFLAETNCRGTNLYVSSELRCLPGATVSVQLPSAEGIYNFTSTNWFSIISLPKNASPPGDNIYRQRMPDVAPNKIKPFVTSGELGYFENQLANPQLIVIVSKTNLQGSNYWTVKQSTISSNFYNYYSKGSLSPGGVLMGPINIVYSHPNIIYDQLAYSKQLTYQLAGTDRGTDRSNFIDITASSPFAWLSGEGSASTNVKTAYLIGYSSNLDLSTNFFRPGDAIVLGSSYVSVKDLTMSADKVGTLWIDTSNNLFHPTPPPVDPMSNFLAHISQDTNGYLQLADVNLISDKDNTRFQIKCDGWTNFIETGTGRTVKLKLPAKKPFTVALKVRGYPELIRTVPSTAADIYFFFAPDGQELIIGSDQDDTHYRIRSRIRGAGGSAWHDIEESGREIEYPVPHEGSFEIEACPPGFHPKTLRVIDPVGEIQFTNFAPILDIHNTQL